METLRQFVTVLQESAGNPDRYMSFFAGFMTAVVVLSAFAMLIGG